MSARGDSADDADGESERRDSYFAYPTTDENVEDVINDFIKTLKGLGVRVVVLDMDKTVTAQHSGGAIPRGDPLQAFVKSITPVARLLIPALIKAGFQLAIATFSDDLYTHTSSGTASSNFIAGNALVRAVLSDIVTEEQIRQMPIVTLNPGLYEATTAAKHAKLEGFYREKLETLLNTHEELGRPQRERDRLKNSAEGKGTSNVVQPFNPKALAAQFRYPPPPCKHLHLQLLTELYQCEPRAVCLIDDTIENVQKARASNYVGVEVRPVPSGLDAGDLTMFMELNKPHKKLPFAC